MHNERCMSGLEGGHRKPTAAMPHGAGARPYLTFLWLEASSPGWRSGTGTRGRVLSWRLSITMEAGFCVEAVEEALARHGKPEIFNTDQGSQFTSTAFTGLLTDNAIAISMDGRGAWRDCESIRAVWMA